MPIVMCMCHCLCERRKISKTQDTVSKRSSESLLALCCNYYHLLFLSFFTLSMVSSVLRASLLLSYASAFTTNRSFVHLSPLIRNSSNNMVSTPIKSIKKMFGSSSSVKAKRVLVPIADDSEGEYRFIIGEKYLHCWSSIIICIIQYTYLHVLYSNLISYVPLYSYLSIPKRLKQHVSRIH